MGALERWTVGLLVLGAAAGCRPASERAPAAWTPDSVPNAYAVPTAALMWPGATRAWQVRADGDLYNGAWMLRIAPACDGAVAAPPRAIADEARWCPVVRWTRDAGEIRWTFEAVALPAPEDFSPGLALARLLAARAKARDRELEDAAFAAYSESRLDSLLMHDRRPLERDALDRGNLVVSLEVTASNRGHRPHDASLALTFAPAPNAVSYRAPDAAEPVGWNTAWAGAAGDAPALGWGGVAPPAPSLLQRASLAPGAARAFRFALPAYAMPAAQLSRWSSLPHARRVREARAFWSREVARGAGFELHDPPLEDAIRAARVVLLSLRERRGEDWVPIGGPFHYRDVWIRDGARAAQALAVSGYTDESRALARSFLQFQWAHGAFLSQGGQLDGTGEALWAFAQVSLRPAPGPDTRREALAALAAWRYLERQRARPDRAHGDHVAGMLPFTDPHDAELVNAQLVGNDAWSIAGYRATARLLVAAGLRSEADSVMASLRGYEAEFAAALAATRRADVPPSWQGRGLDWGNLAVGYPCEALAAGDDHLAALVRRYWAPIGGAGLGWYGSPDSLHAYVAADLGTWALLAGHPEIADSVLEATLAWRDGCGGAAECFSASSRDFGDNFPPHPTAAAALLALTRNMLVFDDGDTLQLTLGARAPWWRGASLSAAPTRWGRIDLAFERRGESASWRWSPVPVWTALTLPPGTVRAGALPPGCRPGPSASVVLAPPGASAVRVQLAMARTQPAPTAARAPGRTCDLNRVVFGTMACSAPETGHAGLQIALRRGGGAGAGGITRR